MSITNFMKRAHLPARQNPAQDSLLSKNGVHNRFLAWAWVALSLIGIVAMGAGVAIYWAYSHDMRNTSKRMVAGGQIVQTRYGAMEYHIEGNGPPVLVIHGAGGGYDQGMLIARNLGGANFRWIAPSRFGYLRSALPTDASTRAQAEAFADLLDALGVKQVAILAMSGGAPPSLQFARLYPERVSALVLLSSAPYTPLTAGEQKLPVPSGVYQALFSSDFPIWLLQKIAPHSLDTMFDVSPALRAQLTTEEQTMVSSLTSSFQPVTWRVKGLVNEGAAIDPQANYRLEEINVPTLVIHAEDDHINPFSIGQYTAAHIRGAKFLPLTTGGHLLLGHHVEIRATVNLFLRQNAVDDKQ